MAIEDPASEDARQQCVRTSVGAVHVDGARTVDDVAEQLADVWDCPVSDRLRTGSVRLAAQVRGCRGLGSRRASAGTSSVVAAARADEGSYGVKESVAANVVQETKVFPPPTCRRSNGSRLRS